MAQLQLKLPNSNPFKWFLLVVLILILLLSLFGCSPDFYCKRCPVKTKDSITTVIKDSISFRDTTIFIPGDSVIFHDSIPCPDYSRQFKSGKATIKVVIKDHYLTAECICDSIAAKLKTLEYWHSRILSSYHSEIKEVNKPKSRFRIFKDWWFYITCLLILGKILIWVLRKYTKLQIPFYGG